MESVIFEQTSPPFKSADPGSMIGRQSRVQINMKLV